MESDLAAGDVVFVWKTKVRCLRALLPDVQKNGRPFHQYAFDLCGKHEMRRQCISIEFQCFSSSALSGRHCNLGPSSFDLK